MVVSGFALLCAFFCFHTGPILATRSTSVLYCRETKSYLAQSGSRLALILPQGPVTLCWKTALETTPAESIQNLLPFDLRSWQAQSKAYLTRSVDSRAFPPPHTVASGGGNGSSA
jgi:hypothetical protein